MRGVGAPADGGTDSKAALEATNGGKRSCGDGSDEDEAGAAKDDDEAEVRAAKDSVDEVDGKINAGERSGGDRLASSLTGNRDDGATAGHKRSEL